jgi:uncharacterized protein YbjT (DUF2867 family)
MRVLVVGANGQLGTRLCRDLLGRGHDVRGSVRTPERGTWLTGAGGTRVPLDLTDAAGFAAALDGVEGVVLPANPVAPRRGDDAARVSAGM